MKVAEFVAVVLAGLLTGSELTSRLIVHPVLWKLDYPEQVRAERRMYRRLGSIDPVLMTGTIVACFLAAGNLTGTRSSLAFAAAGSYTAMLTLTLIGNMPINIQIFRWDENRDDPKRWRRLRRRWDNIHSLRAILDTAGFALIVLAVLH